MKRESGWYWVKAYKNSVWMLKYYNSFLGEWELTFFNMPDDNWWAVIHPERIKSPDE